MMETQVRSVVREAIANTDELSRAAHGARRETMSQLLDALRSELSHIDEALGGGRPVAPLVEDFGRLIDRLSEQIDRFTPELRRSTEAAVHSLRALREELAAASATAAAATPWTIRDSTSGTLCLVALALARTPDTMRAAFVLGASRAAASSLSLRQARQKGGATRSRRSMQRLLEGLWGVAALAAPMVFGYRRREPLVAALHVVAGASTLLGAFLEPRA